MIPKICLVNLKDQSSKFSLPIPATDKTVLWNAFLIKPQQKQSLYSVNRAITKFIYGEQSLIILVTYMIENITKKYFIITGSCGF